MKGQRHRSTSMWKGMEMRAHTKVYSVKMMDGETSYKCNTNYISQHGVAQVPLKHLEHVSLCQEDFIFGV